MNISKLNKRIAIEENVGMVNDGGGNKQPNWVKVAETWAEVRPLNGYEQTIAAQSRQELSHVVTIRYRKDIRKARHRINYNGRILQIEYIINKDERNVELNIHCREVERHESAY